MPIFLLFGTGVYLGLYFNFAALIALSAVAAAAIILTSSAQSFTETAWTLILFWIWVQVGYFVGLIAREFTKWAGILPKVSQSNRV